MGIHTGEPAVADQGYLGLDVHRAARICAVANGGQVLTSKATRDPLRRADRYVVPYYDEVGVEHRKEFQTRKEARSFRWTVRFAQKQKSEYSGPSYSSAELTGGGGGM
jgi:class 3 adenylate cyclase